jgi:hypothetical protein
MPPKDSDASRLSNACRSVRCFIGVSLGRARVARRRQLFETLSIHADANAKRTKYKTYRNKNILARRFFFVTFARSRTTDRVAPSPPSYLDALSYCFAS